MKQDNVGEKLLKGQKDSILEIRVLLNPVILSLLRGKRDRALPKGEHVIRGISAKHLKKSTFPSMCSTLRVLRTCHDIPYM
jgi:hypothetical protein